MASEKTSLCSQRAIFGGEKGMGEDGDPQKGEHLSLMRSNPMFHSLGVCFKMFFLQTCGCQGEGGWGREGVGVWG